MTIYLRVLNSSSLRNTPMLNAQHLLVQNLCCFRSTPFGRTGNLTFSELTESGNSGMDISSGIFTARTDGVYAFSFHANTVSDNFFHYTSNSTKYIGRKKVFNSMKHFPYKREVFGLCSHKTSFQLQILIEIP